MSEVRCQRRKQGAVSIERGAWSRGKIRGQMTDDSENIDDRRRMTDDSVNQKKEGGDRRSDDRRRMTDDSKNGKSEGGGQRKRQRAVSIEHRARSTE